MSDSVDPEVLKDFQAHIDVMIGMIGIDGVLRLMSKGFTNHVCRKYKHQFVDKKTARTREKLFKHLADLFAEQRR